MLDYYSKARDKFNSYQGNEFLIFRIYENIEKSIQTLETLKLEDYKDMQAFNEREDSIANMLWVLGMIMSGWNDSEGFEFPYFIRLLDLTYSPKVLNNLAKLAIGIRLNVKGTTQMFKDVSSIFSLYEPFAKLSLHFERDHQLLATTINEALRDQSELERVPKSLENLLLVIFDDKEVTELVKEQYLRQGIENRTLFISELSKVIQDKYGITKEANREEYYSILGKIILVTFIVDKSNEMLISVMLLAERLTSIYIL